MMKRFLLGLAVVGTALAFSLPAMADVWVYADIQKYVTKNVTETVTIDKNVDIDVVVDLDLDSAAEAEAIVNQLNAENSACDNCAEKDSLIDADAFMGVIGIINVNQAPGNMSNQGNILSASIDFGGGNEFANATAAVSQLNGAVDYDNYVVDADAVEGYGGNDVHSTNIAWRRDTIEDNAFLGAVGIINVNQSAGQMNNQSNAEAIALADGAVVALSEADLGQFNIGNQSFEENMLDMTDRITGPALSGAMGVVGVNQSAGVLNNQSNSLSIAANISL